MRVTCRVDRQSTGRYALVIIPTGGDLAGAGRVVIYPSALDACRQHAAVAAALRDLGWRLVEYTDPGNPQPAWANAVAA